MKAARRYQQTLRAQSAVETSERIVAAAERLFSTLPFDRVSLDAVAKAAGVSIPTLQRGFGNKEGLLEAVGARIRSRVEAQRPPPVADPEAALAQLLAHYEAEGAMVWHWLRQETDVPRLAPLLAEARAFHRAWVEKAFTQALSSTPARHRARKLDALVAATDLYVWKLLRIDLDRSPDDVHATMKAMALAVARGES